MGNKLNKSELQTLKWVAKETESSGKFRWLKINLIWDIVVDYKNDVLPIRKIQDRRNIASLIQKEMLQQSASAGMWNRYIFTKQALELLKNS